MPEVSWFFFDRKLTSNDKFVTSISPTGELMLEIRNFTWNDVGNYKVQATNDLGTVERSVRVDMAGKLYFQQL